MAARPDPIRSHSWIRSVAKRLKSRRAGVLTDAERTRELLTTLEVLHSISFWQGEKHERTDWHRIVAFNGLAETLARLGKGDEVAVHGRLQSNTFEDREGKKRTTIKVVAETIQFLNLKNRDEAGDEASPAGDDDGNDGSDDIPF